MNDMLRRNAALQKTADKYRSKAFAWGKFDCVKMARTHLRNMGHRPPKMPAYRSALGARSALKKAGHADLESLFDALLPRITPAEMLPGDIALTRGTDRLDAAYVCVGRKLMGWIEGEEHTVMIVPLEIKAAYRA